MTSSAELPILIFGSMVREPVKNKFLASGTAWIHRRLDSSPENWKKILDMLRDTPPRATLLYLNEGTYNALDSKAYKSLTTPLLSALKSAPLLVFAHESLYTGEEAIDRRRRRIRNLDIIDDYDDDIRQLYYVPDHPEVAATTRQNVNEMLEKAGVELVIYKTNAEASTIASSFIDDHLSNLVFRIYIPAGRLFEEESEQILRMFQDWLAKVRNTNLRRGGYQTNRGRVIEFFSDGSMETTTWNGELSQFSHFMGIVEDRDQATSLLVNLGLNEADARSLVSQYARRVRRIQIDMKHERARKVLDIQSQLLEVQQELESELIDTAENVPQSVIEALVEQLVPSHVSSNLSSTLRLQSNPHRHTIQINNQTIHKVEGLVAQNIHSNVTQAIEVEEILRLINQLAGAQAADLSQAVYELSDPEAPTDGRVSAKQRLGTFLIRARDQIGMAAFNTLHKWIEQQIGL